MGQTLSAVRVRGPSLLRTYRPDVGDFEGRKVKNFRRLGKRVVWCFEGDYYLVFHLMISARFHWKSGKQLLPKSKQDLAAFQFPDGTMMLTEAGSKKRAGLWCQTKWSDVEQLSRGGLNVLEASFEDFCEALTRSNNTMKRALADPSRFDGIGNAYSDEILHSAHISPLKRTHQLNDVEQSRLYEACREVLKTWIQRLQTQAGEGFPEKVTAFRKEMAVHGKFGDPCPVCKSPVQRICYAENECNYCPGCQTEGRILADRSLSRLLKDDWPKSLDELE